MSNPAIKQILKALARIEAHIARQEQQQQTAPVRIRPYSAKEAADALGRSHDWTLRQIRGGKIETLPGRPYRIMPDAIKQLQQSLSQ